MNMKRKNLISILFIMVISVIMLLTGCSSKNTDETIKSPTNEAQSKDASNDSQKTVPATNADNKKETIEVAFDVFAPWRMDDNGNASGIDKEILDALAKKLNMNIHYNIVPVSRAVEGMKDGTYDLLAGKLRNPDRETFMNFIEPPYMAKSSKVFYVLKGNKDKIKKFEDLYNLKVGVINGSKYFTQFDEDTKVVKEPGDTNKINFDKLIAGRVDAVVITDSEGDYFIKQNNLTDKVL